MKGPPTACEARHSASASFRVRFPGACRGRGRPAGQWLRTPERRAWPGRGPKRRRPSREHGQTSPPACRCHRRPIREQALAAARGWIRLPHSGPCHAPKRAWAADFRARESRSSPRALRRRRRLARAKSAPRKLPIAGRSGRSCPGADRRTWARLPSQVAGPSRGRGPSARLEPADAASFPRPERRRFPRRRGAHKDGLRSGGLSRIGGGASSSSF